MNQQHPCGCVDRTIAMNCTYLYMCPHHLAIANNPANAGNWRSMMPPMHPQFMPHPHMMRPPQR